MTVASTRIVKSLMACLFALTLFLLIAPWPALFRAADTRAPAWLLVGYWILVAEKAWCMFFRMPQRLAAEKQTDWTAVTVGYSYAAVLVLVLLGLVFGHACPYPAPLRAVAGAVWFAAVVFRYVALRHLKHQWTVDVGDRDVGNRELIESGPYGVIRHPLYTGAIAEAIAAAVMFASTPALVVAVFVFTPFEVHRARVEERHLREIFGDAYREYAGRVPGFFPFPRPHG